MSFNITTSVYCEQDRNMNLDEGTTCETLRNILYAAGLDTHASNVRVFRDGKIHIGRMDGFVLREGDHVEFRNSYDLVIEHDVPKKAVNKQPEPVKDTPVYDQVPKGFPTRDQLTNAITAIFESFHIG